MQSTQIVVDDHMIDILLEKLAEMKTSNEKVIQLKGQENQVVLIHGNNQKLKKS